MDRRRPPIPQLHALTPPRTGPAPHVNASSILSNPLGTVLRTTSLNRWNRTASLPFPVHDQPAGPNSRSSKQSNHHTKTGQGPAWTLSQCEGGLSAVRDSEVSATLIISVR